MSLEKFRKWLEDGIRDGAKYMMVYTDDFDYLDYPVYVKDSKEYFTYKSTSRDRLMEVYDLSLDIEEQLREKRAYHPPV